MKFTIKKVHIILIILGSVFVSLGIFHSNIWFDEAYSVAIAKHSFSEIWSIGGNDVHPILYYWLLHIISVITNNSIIIYRIFSVIPIIILGILGYTHIKKDFGNKEGFIFSLLVYTIPVTAVYSNQIRMYSWAILSVTILAIYAYRIFKGNENNKNLIIFGLASWFSIYIHYYGLMAAGIINLILLGYLILKKKNKTAIKITIMGVIQFVSYIPWMINFVTQLKNVSEGFWIGFEVPKTPVELLSFEYLGESIIENFGVFQYTIFALAIMLYIYIGIKLYKIKKEKIDIKAPTIALIIYFAVILAALIITLFMKTSILYYRYLFVITGLYIFVISFILAKEKNKYVSMCICSAIVITGLINNIKMINDNYDISNKLPIEYMKSNISEEDTIVYSDIRIGSIVANIMSGNRQYFYNADHWNVEEAYEAFAPTMETVENEEFVNECGNRIWIVGDSTKIYSLFDNDEYRKVSEEKFNTKYQNNYYSIILIERVNSNAR